MSRIAFLFASNGPETMGMLQFAESDADRVAETLKGPRCGFEIRRPAAKADPYDVRRDMDSAAASCGPQDTFVCFFAGHGVIEGGELFLVWHNTDEDFRTTAIPVDHLLATLRRCRARNRLLILDCCHAGVALTRGGVPFDEIPPITSANHLILMASGRLEKAREFKELSGGFLSSKICEALGPQFHSADKNKDLKLSINEMMDWLTAAVAQFARDRRTQVPTPRLYGEQTGGEFCFTSDVLWSPYEIPWPDGSTLVVLPTKPFSFGHWELPGQYALCIGKEPVTNLQFAKFIEAMAGRRSPLLIPPDRGWRRRRGSSTPYIAREPQGKQYDFKSRGWVEGFRPFQDQAYSAPELPVVCVSLEDAVQYSKFAQRLTPASFSGAIVDIPPYRLWDFAAFGSEFPQRDPALWRYAKAHQKSLVPANVKRSDRPINDRGISDMLGNVWEWCGTLFGLLSRLEDPSFERNYFEGPWEAEVRDPVVALAQLFKYYEQGVGVGLGARYWEGELARLRGGGFFSDLAIEEPFLMESEDPDGKNIRHSDLGFRIAALLPVTTLPDDIQLRLSLLPPAMSDFGTKISAGEGGHHGHGRLVQCPTANPLSETACNVLRLRGYVQSKELRSQCVSTTDPLQRTQVAFWAADRCRQIMSNT